MFRVHCEIWRQTLPWPNHRKKVTKLKPIQVIINYFGKYLESRVEEKIDEFWMTSLIKLDQCYGKCNIRTEVSLLFDDIYYITIVLVSQENWTLQTIIEIVKSFVELSIQELGTKQAKSQQ